MISSADFHKDFSSLHIATHEIGVGGMKLVQTLSPNTLSALLFEPNNQMFSWQAMIPVAISFDLERENAHSFKVAIAGVFTLNSVCVGCLEPLEHQFSLDFSIRMLEKEHFVTHATESTEWKFDSDELDMSIDESLSVGYFANHCIDLGVLLRDQIFYEAPDYPHCLSCNHRSTKADLEDDERKQNNPFLKLLNKTR